MRPCSPQAEVERSHIGVARLGEFPTEAALAVEQVASKESGSVEPHVGGSVLVQQLRGPSLGRFEVMGVAGAIGGSDCVETVGHAEERKRVVSEVRLTGGRSSALLIDVADER